MSSSDHFCGYYPGTLSRCQVSATHLKIGQKSTGAHTSNELQWLDWKIWHQDRNPSNAHQGDMPYYIMITGPRSLQIGCIDSVIVPPRDCESAAVHRRNAEGILSKHNTTSWIGN